MAERSDLAGFLQATRALPSEGDGELVATLLEVERTIGLTRAVLYVHGYVDYFFQTHLANAMTERGLHFAAVDLRRSGRSLRPGNRAHFANSIDDYFSEISWAIDELRARGTREVVLIGHSTGGLISTLYAARAEGRAAVVGLALNSPFFRFVGTDFERVQLEGAARLGAMLPHLPVRRGLPPVYGKTIHRSESGEFEYDLTRKPLHGFPVHTGWIRMIVAAQKEVEAGLAIACPVLLLHSDRSRIPGPGPDPSAEDFVSDTVLDVEDMKRLGPRIGRDVELVEIRGGLHDLTLSREPARTEAVQRLAEFAVSVQRPRAL